MGTLPGPGDLAGVKSDVLEGAPGCGVRRDGRLCVWEFDVLSAGQACGGEEAREPCGGASAAAVTRDT